MGVDRALRGDRGTEWEEDASNGEAESLEGRRDRAPNVLAIVWLSTRGKMHEDAGDEAAKRGGKEDGDGNSDEDDDGGGDACGRDRIWGG